MRKADPPISGGSHFQDEKTLTSRSDSLAGGWPDVPASHPGLPVAVAQAGGRGRTCFASLHLYLRAGGHVVHRLAPLEPEPPPKRPPRRDLPWARPALSGPCLTLL